MERRSFLKMSAALGGAATVASFGASAQTGIKATGFSPIGGEENVNWSSCLVNCGSNCAIKVFSRDGVVTRVETDHEVEDVYGLHQIRCCARGRSLRQRTYAVDRIKTPMRRIGERGDGKYEPISWDEATTLIADKLKTIIADKENGGNKQIFRSYGSGAYYGFASNLCFNRLFNMMGGCLNAWGNYSWAQQMEAAKHTYSTYCTNGSSISTLKDTDYFLGFAYNPSEIRQSGSGEGYDFVQALKNNPDMKVVMVDPRYTDTMLGKESQWLPIRPGTDAAFVEAVIYEMISSGWVDANARDFLNKNTVGFDAQSIEAQKEIFRQSGDKKKMEYAECMDSAENYEDYILSRGKYAQDHQRTPEWAERICGVPAAQIRQVAQDLMKAKRPYVVTGAGINRQANGEQSIRAIYMLALMTGKVGLPGTNNGEMPYMSSIVKMAIPQGTNPVKESISFFTWSEAVQNGKEFTQRTHGLQGTTDPDQKLGANIKFIFSASDSSLLNQHTDINGTKKLLQEAKDLFIVSCDCWMTPSAKMADIILPDTSWLESQDFANDSYASGNLGYWIAMSSSIGTIWDGKSMFDVANMIGKKMGLDYDEGKTEDQWLEELYQKVKAHPSAQGVSPAFPATYKEAQKIGIFRKDKGDNNIAMKSLVQDGQPLKTPSGKIEIHSAELAWRAKNWKQNKAMGDIITAIPQYTVTWDGYEDAETAKKYPLQMSSYHTKGRVHSSYHNVPWLREAVEDAVWVSPTTAAEYGLVSGDKVEIYNDRGSIEVPVRVTPRIAPGVISLGQGAWHVASDRLGATGHKICTGGAINNLTRYMPSPLAKGNPQLTMRVQMKKA